MQIIKYRRMDEITRGRVSSMMAMHCKDITYTVPEEEIPEGAVRIEPDTHLAQAYIKFMRIRYYLQGDSRFWVNSKLPELLDDEIKPLMTSRNMASKRIKEYFKDTVYVLQNLPFKLCFVVDPSVKKRATLFHLIMMCEHKTPEGMIYWAGSNFSNVSYITTHHCFTRLCERLGLDKYQVNSVKEIFAASLFNKPYLIYENMTAYLVFNDFMCLGMRPWPKVERIYMFKTIITRDMYTEAQCEMLNRHIK